MSVFLNSRGFSDAVRKFAPKAFLTDLIGILLGIKFEPIAARISEEGKKKGAELPDEAQLICYLQTAVFDEITTRPALWGFGLVLRIQKTESPLS